MQNSKKPCFITPVRPRRVVSYLLRIFKAEATQILQMNIETSFSDIYLIALVSQDFTAKKLINVCVSMNFYWKFHKTILKSLLDVNIVTDSLYIAQVSHLWHGYDFHLPHLLPFLALNLWTTVWFEMADTH